MKKSGLLLVLGLVMLASLPAQGAQGFYIGTGMGFGVPNQSGDMIDKVEPQAAFALELIHLGYNFTDNIGLSMQWGTAVGETDWSPDADLFWGQDYMTFCGRYTVSGSDFQPYFEAGPGFYSYSLIADEWIGVSEPTLGARVALGGNYMLGHLYLSPEISYHFTNYREMDVEDDIYGDVTVDFHERGNMLLMLLKVGYNFGN